MVRLRTALLATILGVALLSPPVTAGAEVTLQSLSAESAVVTWSSWLPSFVAEFDPASAEDCIAGRDKCATKTIHEMSKRLDDLAPSCSHNAIFSLAYLRITQGYAWIRDTRNADGTPHYADREGLNFVVEVFARAYIHAYDEWMSGGTPPTAWRMAFEAAETKQVNGNGDLLLGISAHINRDLPFVMAASGLVSPDGMSRKPDFDQVNELLYRISPALNAELAARFDPSIRNEDGGLTDPAIFQLILGWRERAWRNAEALVSASTEAERELVAQRIELTAETEAALLLASSTYQPPLTGTEARDSHCATHYEDPPPMAYPFTPR